MDPEGAARETSPRPASRRRLRPAGAAQRRGAPVTLHQAESGGQRQCPEPSPWVVWSEAAAPGPGGQAWPAVSLTLSAGPPPRQHMDHYSRTKAIADQLTLMANGTPLPGGCRGALLTAEVCALQPAPKDAWVQLSSDTAPRPAFQPRDGSPGPRPVTAQQVPSTRQVSAPHQGCGTRCSGPGGGEASSGWTLCPPRRSRAVSGPSLGEE